MHRRRSREERRGVPTERGQLEFQSSAPPPPSSPPFIALVGAPRWALVGPALGAPFKWAALSPHHKSNPNLILIRLLALKCVTLWAHA